MARVAILVGSLRQASITRKVALTLIELAPPGLDLAFVEVGDLPLYNEDLEATVPLAWARFREQMLGVDAVLFATPEYNRSVPGGLKNAIDVGSRPAGKSVFKGKPACVVSVSPGAMGGFGANHHVRQSLVFLDMPTLQQPEAYVGNAAALFDEAGKMINEGTRAFLGKILAAFADLIARSRQP